jgi:hypothetical protein
MENEFTTLIMSEIVKRLLVEQKDQWGNTNPSPLMNAVQKWFETNKEVLLKTIFESIPQDKLADYISDRVKEAIGYYVKDGRYSNYDKEEYQKKLNERVFELVAKNIAEEKIKELQKIN